MNLKINDIDIRAISVAGIETCIEFPSFGFAFDIGRCPSTAIELPVIFLTHGHMDHISGLAYHAVQRSMHGLKPATYVVPAKIHADVLNMLDAFDRLACYSSPFAGKIVPLEPGEDYKFRGDMIVKPFQSIHRVPCHGYKIIRRKDKLLPEFVGKTAADIVAAKKQGVAITSVVETVLMAFTGDTVVDVLDKNPELYEAELLIMEVSFLDELVPVEQARMHGHVHLSEMVARADKFQNKNILFTHFSARYSAEQIQKILLEKLPASLYSKVTPLLPDGGLRV